MRAAASRWARRCRPVDLLAPEGTGQTGGPGVPIPGLGAEGMISSQPDPTLALPKDGIVLKRIGLGRRDTVKMMDAAKPSVLPTPQPGWQHVPGTGSVMFGRGSV